MAESTICHVCGVRDGTHYGSCPVEVRAVAELRARLTQYEVRDCWIDPALALPNEGALCQVQRQPMNCYNATDDVDWMFEAGGRKIWARSVGVLRWRLLPGASGPEATNG